MCFDIQQRLFGDNGEYSEEEAEEYRQQLIDLFAESPEGRALLDEGIDLGWAEILMVYGMSYEGVTPATMTPWHLEAVVFRHFPRKVSAQPEEAAEAIREIYAFWQFLDREFGLKIAKACLEILDDRAAKRLARELGRPANFGMAKSFFIAGEARGFDLSNEEGLQQWMQVYNAELASQNQVANLPEPHPLLVEGGSARRRCGSSRTRRKMQRKSRKRNRKK